MTLTKKSIGKFKKAFDKESNVNVKTKEGYITYIGGTPTERGILTKIIGDVQYFCINGEWVKWE